MTIEELYRQYAQDVFRFASWLCANPAEAEDIVSETFLRAWTSTDRFEVGTVKAYLFVIARHQFLKLQRRSRAHAELSGDLPDRAPGPACRAEEKDELTAAMNAMQALPEIDRAALLMRAQHNLAYDEIARSLGISLAAAKVKVHRARLKLAAIRHDQENSQ